MKIFYLYLYVFFIANPQINFKEYYKKATEDYKNSVINSPYYDKAIKACPNIEEYPKLLLYKGIDLFMLNKPVLAIKYLELARMHVKNDADKILITNNLALIYSEIGNYKKGNFYFKETLEKAIETKDTFFEEEVRFNMLLNDYDLIIPNPPITKFWDFYNKLPKKSKEKKFEYLNIFFELNNARFSNNEAKEIRNHLYKNFVIDSFDKNLKGFFYNNNTTLNLNLKEYDIALKYNDTSYVISKQYLGTEEILNDLYNYKEIYEGKKELEIALKYVDSIQAIEDKIRKEIQNISTEIIDENILFNKTKKNIERSVISYKIYVSIFFIALILFLFFYIIRNKKQKEKLKKLNSELILKKGEYNKTLQNNIHFKNEVKSLLKEKKFDELQKMYKKYELEDLNTEVHHKYLVSEITPSFIQKINSYKIPFSDIEKLLLFYRKEKHTYKEISVITNRTLRSIQGLSYRLNKKINLELNISLTDFIEKL
ncbi:hypothetical protein H9I45_08385 [Polaribacter haliotis]|uniref:Tetratricopeptide repeat protein n=1 Tax=Polaribacter haliotis TaxID=1888915 RepID=A0A7L8ABP3_9FLAO|nr:hypothetical protein [Polaribacter haliotis]QOD59391.1 hypothetical protein H9I45_08385 [Polaribacter haliotis]